MKKLLLLLVTSILFSTALQAQSSYTSYYDPEGIFFAEPTGTYHQWEASMSYTCFVFINNNQVTDNTEAWELAAFVGDELRGYQFMRSTGKVFLQIYGEDGEQCTLKLYDHLNEVEYTNCEEAPITINTTATGSTVAVHFTVEDDGEITYPFEIEPAVFVEFGCNHIIYAVIQINGVDILPADTNRWEMGFFSGTQCRGTTKDQWGVTPPTFTHHLEANMLFYGYKDEELQVVLYDKENECFFTGRYETSTIAATKNCDDVLGTGREPIIFNFLLPFEKEIIAYDETAENPNRYYLISSPIGEVSPADVENMLENDFDLYYFKQDPTDEVGLEWINYEGPDGNYNLEAGKGYLYANSVTDTLRFWGSAYDGDGIVTLDKKEGATVEFPGWNLVGNPFGVTAYIDRPFYTMNEEGFEVVAGSGNSVAPMEGIFVIAEEDGETMTFSTEDPNAKTEQIVIDIKKNRGNVIDRAIVRLGETRTLPKFMLQANSTKLYIPQADANYAVVRSSSENEMPVNFKANQNGTYTLSVNQENVEMKSMTLIDNLTGANIDLLSTPNYQFNANVNDPESRFSISFKANTSVESQEILSPISYRSNGQLIIVGLEGESKLQVIDMLGRIISNNTISGEHSEMLNVTPGVYTIRLINNDNTFVQKIVVE